MDYCSCNRVKTEQTNGSDINWVTKRGDASNLSPREQNINSQNNRAETKINMIG